MSMVEGVLITIVCSDHDIIHSYIHSFIQSINKYKTQKLRSWQLSSSETVLRNYSYHERSLLYIKLSDPPEMTGSMALPPRPMICGSHQA